MMRLHGSKSGTINEYPSFPRRRESSSRSPVCSPPMAHIHQRFCQRRSCPNPERSQHRAIVCTPHLDAVRGPRNGDAERVAAAAQAGDGEVVAMAVRHHPRHHHPIDPDLQPHRSLRLGGILRPPFQVKARPPTFALFLSQPGELPDSYQRYLVNGLRGPFKLEGVPIRLLLRASSSKNPYEED